MKIQPNHFSIIMPAFNAANTIINSVKSVQDQTDKNWELIIVDDHSQDRTSEIVKQMQIGDSRIRLIKNSSNQGVALSRNTALMESNGKYIAFLDSDDIWTNEKLTYQREQFNCGAQVVFGSYKRIYPDGSYQIVKAKRKISTRTFKFYNPIGNLTGAYDRSLGLVLQKKLGHEDYLMWHEIVKRAGLAYGTENILGHYYINSTSLSGNKMKAAKWHWAATRTEMNLSFGQASIGFIGYVAYSAAIRMKPRRIIVNRPLQNNNERKA